MGPDSLDDRDPDEVAKAAEPALRAMQDDEDKEAADEAERELADSEDEVDE